MARRIATLKRQVSSIEMGTSEEEEIEITSLEEFFNDADKDLDGELTIHEFASLYMPPDRRERNNNMWDELKKQLWRNATISLTNLPPAVRERMSPEQLNRLMERGRSQNWVLPLPEFARVFWEQMVEDQIRTDPALAERIKHDFTSVGPNTAGRIERGQFVHSPIVQEQSAAWMAIDM